MIIDGDAPLHAKQSAYLLEILRQLGWSSLNDTRTIKPNLSQCKTYITEHAHHLKIIFSISFIVPIYDLIDFLNPYFIKVWHIQIVGNPTSASIELLRQIK